jgi:hypothetical protein
MPQHLFPAPRALAAAALLAGLAGLVACSAEPTAAPAGAEAATPALAISGFSTVIPIQLRGLPPNPILPPSPIYGWGNLQLKVNVAEGDACLPPSPITPEPGTTAVAVCGKIFNEGGARYVGGGLYTVPSVFGEGPGLVATFGGAVPPDACRRYDIGGSIVVSDAIAADLVASPASYQVLFDGFVPAGASVTSDGTTSGATQIGGRLDGSAWGPVGERPATDPYFAVKVCAVSITP